MRSKVLVLDVFLRLIFDVLAFVLRFILHVLGRFGAVSASVLRFILDVLERFGAFWRRFYVSF